MMTTPLLHRGPSPSPQPDKSRRSSDVRCRISRLEKYSSPSTSTLRRAFNTRASASLPFQKHRGSAVMHPLPQSTTLTIDPFREHPFSELKPSSSARLTMLEEQSDDGGDDMENLGNDGNTTVSTEAGKINEKVSAMLAATEALKPASGPAPHSSGSKMSRIVTKMSSAWGKLHSRTSTSDLKMKGKNVFHALLLDMLTLEEPIQEDEASSLVANPVETMKIRRKESDSPNREQVQKAVGSPARRKPVADNGRSLGGGESSEDTFADARLHLTRTTIDSQPTDSNPERGSDISPLPETPFKSEVGFENDLEYRILRTTPDGSSTPCIIIDASLLADLKGSPKQKQAKSSAITDPLRTISKINMGPVESAQDPITSTGRNGRKRVVESEMPLDHHAIDDSPDDCKRMKKHPSPDKLYLESLEIAFQQYNNLKMSGADDDKLDELAGVFSPPARSHASRDIRRMALDKTLPHRRKPSSSKVGFSSRITPFPQRQSRISRLADNPLKLHTGTRFGRRFRPIHAGADNTDELQ